MTTALCLSCGNIKPDEDSSCPECGAGSTGDIELDLTFSGNYLAETTLAQFGDVIKTINQAVDDTTVRRWTFLYYVSQVHPEIMEAKQPPEIAAQVKSLYASLEFPPVEILPGNRQLLSFSDSDELLE